MTEKYIFARDRMERLREEGLRWQQQPFSKGGQRVRVLRYSRNCGPRSSRLSANSTVAFQHAELVASVVACAFEGVAKDLFERQQALDSVGEL